MKKQTKKANSNLIIYILLLAIITAIVMSGTFARYTSKDGKEGTGYVAKWSFNVNGLGNEALTKAGIKEGTIIGDKIAPGTEGYFTVGIDATGSDVAVEYKVKIPSVENKPSNLYFYKIDQNEEKIKVANYEEYGISGVIYANDENKVKTEKIYWKWEYETEGENADKDDTDDGKNIEQMVISISAVGTQYLPQTYGIKYNLDGGELGEGSLQEYEVALGGTLVAPRKEGYVFTGWTGSNGDIPQKEVIIAKNSREEKTYTANWTEAYYKNITTNEQYVTLNEAITNSATNTQINAIKNATETIEVTIPNEKNITLNPNGYTIALNNTSGIINSGTLKINGFGKIQGISLGIEITNNGTLDISGSVELISENYVINNTNSGIINMSGGTISNTAEINTHSSIGIHNVGSAVITGGTVSGMTGIYNYGTITLGLVNGEISTTNPYIYGSAIGIYVANGTINYYSGKIVGSNTSFTNKISAKPNGYIPIVSTENGNAVVTLQRGFYGNDGILGYTGGTVTRNIDGTATIASGVTQYGPYISLDEGTYEISYVGTNLSTDTSRYVSYDSVQVYSLTHIYQSSSSVTYRIVIPSTVSRLEFVYYNNIDGAVLNYITISKIS